MVNLKVSAPEHLEIKNSPRFLCMYERIESEMMYLFGIAPFHIRYIGPHSDDPKAKLSWHIIKFQLVLKMESGKKAGAKTCRAEP